MGDAGAADCVKWCSPAPPLPLQAPGPVITQTCGNQNPVQNIQLAKGWNWMGNPKLGSTTVTGLSPDFQTFFNSFEFSPNDEIKVRGFNKLSISRYDGGEWQGNLKTLLTGEGYEVKVENAVTVTFGN